MSNTNSLGVLTAQLSPVGQQRLFEFLDVVDTETAARFRGWLSTAPEAEVGAAAERLNRTSHGREFAAWWSSHDKVPALQAGQAPAQSRTRRPIEPMHSQAHARSANRDLTVGGAWLLGGLLVTLVSYGMAASSPGGGHYVIATGRHPVWGTPLASWTEGTLTS
jgi:hypothetical protein